MNNALHGRVYYSKKTPINSQVGRRSPSSTYAEIGSLNTCSVDIRAGDESQAVQIENAVCWT